MQTELSPVQQIIARCKEVVELAKLHYGVDMSQVQVGFNKGRCGGKAGGKKLRDPVISNYYVKFNADMIHREAFETILNEVVAHEYAHVLCYIRPELGEGHDYGWQQVCLKLGGSGETRHSEEVVYGTGYTYEYTTDTGHKVRLSNKRHRQIEAGGTLTYSKSGKGRVFLGCTYYIVGSSGFTLDKPMGPYCGKPAASAGIAPASVGQIPYRVSSVTVQKAPSVPVTPPTNGESKASISRRIIRSWYVAGKSYEQIIAEMMRVNGYDRQLARGTFKANAPKVGVPLSF